MDGCTDGRAGAAKNCYSRKENRERETKTMTKKSDCPELSFIITKLKVKSAGANNNYTRGTNTQGKIEMVNKS